MQPGRMLPTMLVKAEIEVTGASWVIFPILRVQGKAPGSHRRRRA